MSVQISIDEISFNRFENRGLNLRVNNTCTIIEIVQVDRQEVNLADIEREDIVFLFGSVVHHVEFLIDECEIVAIFVVTRTEHEWPSAVERFHFVLVNVTLSSIIVIEFVCIVTQIQHTVVFLTLLDEFLQFCNGVIAIL